MSNQSLEGKVALVTGASSGLGRGFALALAAAGVKVFLVARREEELRQVVEEVARAGGEAAYHVADVRVTPSLYDLVDVLLSRFKRLDILVNNAGLGHFAKVQQLGAEQFDEMWAVNVRGVFLLTKAVLPSMSERRSGDIVNIASLAGRNSFVGGAGYSATKWALIGFARSLMLEVRGDNIRVITLCPGSVDTDFAGPGRTPPRPGVIPTADDIAAVAIDALSMPRSVMVSEIDIRPTNPKA